MTGIPHPFTMTIHAAQRRADLYALADRERLSRLAHQRAGRRQPRTGFAAIFAVMVAVALVLAAGSALAQGGPHPAPSNPSHAQGSTVTQAPEEHLLDPSAARQVQATRL